MKMKIELTIKQNYKELCNEITHLDDKIRFAGIINDNGRLVTGAANNEVKFLVERKDRIMLFMEAALRTRMLSDFDDCLGSMNFSIYHRKNIVTMEFPIRSGTVYVSSEKDIDLNSIPFKIIALLTKENTKVLKSIDHSQSSLLVHRK